MKKALIILPLFVSLLLGGCQTHEHHEHKKKVFYSKFEYSKMTYCMGMTDSAMFAARLKLKKIDKQKLVDFYSKQKKNSALNIAIVNKVYAADFKNAWTYGVKFFKNCASNMASGV